MDDSALWLRYKLDPQLPLRNQLLEKYLPLVTQAAKVLAYKIPGDQEEELQSDGVLGLLRAIERYDPERGLSFSTFAMWHIRGAMIDAIRRRDWIPRVTRQRHKRFAQIRESFFVLTGREPRLEELADLLAMPESIVQQWQRGGAVSTVESLQQTIRQQADWREVALQELLPDTGRPVGQPLERRDLLEYLFADLKAADQRLLQLYYFERWSMEQIAPELGVCPMTISTRHKRLLQVLQAKVRRQALVAEFFDED